MKSICSLISYPSYSFPGLRRCIFLTALCWTLPVLLHAQGVIPTKGTDFWVGFPFNPEWSAGTGTKRCDVFITSESATSGTISIPLQGWSQPFTVVANVTTTISLPVSQVENVLSETPENRGVHIISNDTVSVFAISFERYTADGTVIYPQQSTGTEYRIGSYPGLSNSSFHVFSDFLITATQDGTQVEITPTSATLNGHAANVPFTVTLDAGQCYQVLASNYQDDLTGTRIRGTDSSGSCRNFSVFSGSVCVNIPSGCGACDILYEQALPVAYWGKTYYAVPFSFQSGYTIRILADQNGTTYTINGGASSTLNAGQWTEINNIAGTQCVQANKPFSVIQYMQGINCSGAGDPSMMYLNADDQKIDRITFSTVTSTIITQHNVNVIMNTSCISQLRLDGNPVPASSFQPMTYCTSVSYAQLSLTQGSHTLSADSGFTAYVYGTGSAESYAYSVGSFSRAQPIIVDSVLCTTDTIHLGTTQQIFSPWWSTMTNPQDTIGVGPVLTLVPPIYPDIYVEHGNEIISGCPNDFYFNVDVPTPPVVSIAQTADTACVNQLVQLNASPVSAAYSYSWTPTTGLSNPSIPNPVATVTASTWYKLAVSSISGCANTVYDSTYIYMLPITLPSAFAGSDQSLCYGDSVTLGAAGGVSYLWLPGNVTDDSLVVAPTANTNYVLFLTDSNGCQGTDTVAVTVMPLPSASAGNDTTICEGTPAFLQASGNGGYVWMPGSGFGSSFTTFPVVSTQYYVTVTATNGCTATDSVWVNVHAMPNVQVTPQLSICPGDAAVLVATGGPSYFWQATGDTTASISVSPTATSSYVVNVTDPFGCRGSDTAQVIVNPLPVPSFGRGPACVQEPVAFTNFSTVAGGSVASSQWDFGDTSASGLDNPTHVFANGGAYNVRLIVTSDNGCIDSLVQVVYVNPNPVVFFSGTNACINEALQFTDYSSVSSGSLSSWSWLFGDGLSDTTRNPSHMYSNPGLYNVALTVGTDSGCTSALNVPQAVEAYPLPVPRFTFSPASISILNSEVQFHDQSSGGVTWQWDFGDGTGTSSLVNPHYVYGDTGMHDVSLILIGQHGCTDTIKHALYIEPTSTIYFPNSFTPNGDGRNDVFNAQGVLVREYEILVYDRWGKEVFRSTSLLQGWDGTRQDSKKPCAPDVYVYKARACDYMNDWHDYTGKITLVR